MCDKKIIHLPIIKAFLPYKSIAGLCVRGHLSKYFTKFMLNIQIYFSMFMLNIQSSASLLFLIGMIYHQRDVSSAQVFLHQSQSEPGCKVVDKLTSY